MTEHIYYDANNKNDIEFKSDWFQTNIVEGGLSLCKVCGGLEGGLTTECPGKSISNVVQDDVYFGNIDFIYGEWTIGALNPTNKMWLYGKYIKTKLSDKEFSHEQRVSYEYFEIIKKEWTERGFFK